jgi:hypothetical protein
MHGSDRQDDEDLALKVAAATGGAAAGVGVDLLIGDAGGVIAAAAAAQVLEHGLERVSRHRRRQAEVMLQVAAEAAGRSLDDLLEGITADPTRLHLFAAAAKAAAETTLEAKIRVLGRALATGVLANDDALVDQQRFLVGIVADLEALHLRVLAQLAQPHPRGRVLEAPRGPHERPGWAVDDLAMALSYPRMVVEPILRMLEGHGLATSVGDALGAAYNACAITDAGLEFLELLTERASDLPPAR